MRARDTLSQPPLVVAMPDRRTGGGGGSILQSEISGRGTIKSSERSITFFSERVKEIE